MALPAEARPYRGKGKIVSGKEKSSHFEVIENAFESTY
jgi:hypothetical protein